jgi:hypothetical protein
LVRLALGGVVLTEQEVLNGLAAAGFPTPRTRFENWRERGLVLPCGTRKGLGQGKGRVAHVYPDGTVEQAIKIAQMRRQNLDLDEIGWRLWLADRPVDRKCWFPIFEAGAMEFDEAASDLRVRVDSDRDEDSMEGFADKAYSARTSDPLFKQLRKTLGPDRLPAILLRLAEMAIGGFTSASTQPDAASSERQGDLRAMDVALGLGHARTDTANGKGPIISGDYSPILRETFAPLADTTLIEFLASVDPPRLRKITLDMSALTQTLAEASLELDRTLAKDAFGLRRAALLARSSRMRQAQFGLIWALILERSTEKFHDLGTMAELFAEAANSARKLPQSDEPIGNSQRPDFRRGPERKSIK